MNVIVAPSLLSANFCDLQSDIDMINRSEAEWLHLDVMDGVFVPNISFGFPVIDCVRKICKKKLDAHFMIVHPENYIERAAKSGIESMTIHAETCLQLKEAIAKIHAAGMEAGVAINPATPLSLIENVLEDAEMFLVMTVNPGFGGQAFNEHCVEKVRTLRGMLNERGLKTHIQVDGGINAETAPRIVEAGADVLVSGSYVFKAADPEAVIRSLKG